MEKYFNKFTALIMIFFIVIIVIIQTCHYLNLNYVKEKNFQYRLNEKILYISFLVHNKEKKLQELLIDLSKDSLTAINLDEINIDDLNKICVAWNDEIFHHSFVASKDTEEFKETSKHLDKKCKRLGKGKGVR